LNKSCAAFDLTFRIPLIVTAGIVLLAATINGCGMRNQLTMVVEEFPRASACGHCHIEIFDEWSASPHAKAVYQSTVPRSHRRVPV